MIGLLIISHGSVGKSMVLCAEQILGKKIPNLVCLGVKRHDGLEKTFEEAQDAIALLDQGEGVLVLSDVFGATPCNVAARAGERKGRGGFWFEHADAFSGTQLSPPSLV